MFANRHIYLTAILFLLSVNTMQSQWYVSSGYVPYYPGDNILFGGNNYYLYGINNALQYMSIGPNGVPANIGNVYAGNFRAITSFSNQIVICEDILGGGTWGHASWATRDVSHIVKGTVTNISGSNVVTLIVNGTHIQPILRVFIKMQRLRLGQFPQVAVQLTLLLLQFHLRLLMAPILSI